MKKLELTRCGKFLFSGSDDKMVKVWCTQRAHCVKVFKGHTDDVHSLTLSNDGRILYSGSSDKTIKVWDIASATCLTTFEGHTGYVRSLAVSRDGKQLFSASCDKTLRCWCMRNIPLLFWRRRVLSQRHPRAVLCETLSGDRWELRNIKGDSDLARAVEEQCPELDALAEEIMLASTLDGEVTIRTHRDIFQTFAALPLPTVIGGEDEVEFRKTLWQYICPKYIIVRRQLTPIPLCGLAASDQ